MSSVTVYRPAATSGLDPMIADYQTRWFIQFHMYNNTENGDFVEILYSDGTGGQHQTLPSHFSTAVLIAIPSSVPSVTVSQQTGAGTVVAREFWLF